MFFTNRNLKLSKSIFKDPLKPSNSLRKGLNRTFLDEKKA